MVQDTIKPISFPKDTFINPSGNNVIFSVDMPADSSIKMKKRSEKKSKVKSDSLSKSNHTKSDKSVISEKKALKTEKSTQKIVEKPVIGIKSQSKSSIFELKDSLPGSIQDTNKVLKSVETQVSIFSHHELKQIHRSPQIINKANPDWLFYVILFILIVFTWMKVFYHKALKQIIDAFFKNSIVNQVVRDENILIQKTSLLLTIVFNLIAAVFLYQASVIFGWQHEYIGAGFGRFMIFAFIISFGYFFKFIILKLSGHIFKIDKPIATYIFNLFLINNILGLVLIPIVIGISFMPNPYVSTIVKISIYLIFAAFLYRIGRGLLIGLSFINFSKFYLFLYLCTLELAPLLVLVKILV